MIGWHPPIMEWVKLNCDGSSKLDTGQAGCGGLLRNSERKWMKGYASSIETCTVFHAERLAMWLGLKMAREMGVPKLIIESNSKTLVDMVNNRD